MSKDTPKPNTTNSEPEEPTIDWLIDYLAPNKGNSPLVEFNKNRLKALIASKVREAKQEGFDLGFKAAGGDVIPLEYEALQPREQDKV